MKKIIRYIKSKISNFKYNWGYLGVLNSPFVGLELKWYFGEIKHGTPYFLPRKWVKCDNGSYSKPIPIKYFGFDYTSLGWKTKYDDIRFEWSPSISLVIFGKQLFISIIPKMRKTPEDAAIRVDIYWEAYLTYKYRTDKTKSKHERLEQTMKEYSCIWGNNEKGYMDYYPLILKDKYIK